MCLYMQESAAAGNTGTARLTLSSCTFLFTGSIIIFDGVIRLKRIYNF
jgi:hypothetical protein